MNQDKKQNNDDPKPDFTQQLNDIDNLDQLILEHPSYKQLSEQLALAEQKIQENRSNWLAAQAELENLKRRSEREIANIHKYAIEKFAYDILTTVDNLERSLATKAVENEQLKDFYLGIELTLESLLELLKKYDITPIDPRGEEFNPDRHTAMTTREAINGENQNTVLEVIQKGYFLRDRLLRPALVVVAK